MLVDFRCISPHCIFALVRAFSAFFGLCMSHCVLFCFVFFFQAEVQIHHCSPPNPQDSGGQESVNHVRTCCSCKQSYSDMWPCVTHPSKSCHDKCQLLLNMTHFLYCIDQFSKFDWPLTLWSLLYTSLACKYVTAGRGQICFKAWSEGNVRASLALQTTIRDAIRVVGH